MTAKWQYKEAYEAALVTARELRAENAKLKEGYGSLAQEHVQTVVELSNAYREEDRLKAENTKLRELVKDMLDVMLDYRCDIRMPNSLDYSNEPAVFKERARELGIEVKE